MIEALQVKYAEPTSCSEVPNYLLTSGPKQEHEGESSDNAEKNCSAILDARAKLLADRKRLSARVPKRKARKDVFDKIIDAFTVKRRKTIFEQERDVDIVDFEKSRSLIIQFIRISH